MQEPATFTITILALTRGYIVSGLGGAVACRTPSEVGRTVRNALLQVEKHQQERLAPAAPPQPEPVDFDPPPAIEEVEFGSEEAGYIAARFRLAEAADHFAAGHFSPQEFYAALANVNDYLDEDEIEAEIERARERLNAKEVAP